MDSLDAQTFPMRDVLLVYVMRHSASSPTPINPKDATIRVLEACYPKDHPPTPMEQMGAGAQYVFDGWPSVKFSVHTPVNDVLEPGFLRELKTAITMDPRVRVSVPDFWYCRNNMEKVSPHRWNDNLNLTDMMRGNYIPDMSMFTRETYERVPYDPQHRRASFWIWWIKIFMEFGPFAFSFVRKPLFCWRQHTGQTSGHSDYVLDGTKAFTDWAHKEGLLPPDLIIRPTQKPDIVRLDEEEGSDSGSDDQNGAGS